MTQAAPGLAGSVHHMCFVAIDGQLALVSARNEGIELIDPVDGVPLRQIGSDRIATAVAALPVSEGDDILLAGTSDGIMYGYDPGSGDQVFRDVLGQGAVRDLAVFPDGPAVAVIIDNGLHVWRPGGGAAVRLLDPPGRKAHRLFKVCTFAASGQSYAACAYSDGYIGIWDLDRPEAVPTAQPAHDGQIWSLIATHDDDGASIVVSGGADRRIRVWGEPELGRPDLPPREAFVADGTIRCLGEVSDKRTTMLVTASATGLVALWRLDGPADRPEVEISRHASEVWALACVTTSDGVMVASGDMNGDIQIKHLSTALLDEQTIDGLFQTDTTLWTVAHGETANGPYVACAGVDQVVHVIDPEGRQSPRALARHTSTVRALTAASDRERPHLVSGGADHRVLDWDPATGELRAELPMGHEGEVWALATLRDGDELFLISGGADGSVRMVSLDAEAPEVRVIAADCGEVNTVIPVPAEDGPLVVIGSGKGLRAVSLRNGASRPVALAAVSVACRVQDTSRELVVAALHSGVVLLVDPIAGATVSRFEMSHEAGQVRALASVEVGGTTFVLGGCDDGRVVVWHIDGTLVGNPVRGSTAGIRAMDVVAIAETEASVRGHAAGGVRSALLTAGHDGTVRLWPITTDSPLRSGGSLDRSTPPVSVLLPDQPTARDYLYRNALVETLHDTLASPHLRPPVVVGVCAPWGQGKTSLLRQLRARVDPWTDADGPEPSHRLAAKPGGRRRSSPGVRTRLTRAWALRQTHRAGDPTAPLEYEMRPRAEAGTAAISVWFNPWMYEHADQIWAGLTREILLSVTERLSKPERERLWFDLNLRRTNPAVLRRRILGGDIPRGLWGLIVLALLVLVVVVTMVSTGVVTAKNPAVATLLGPSTLGLITVLLTIAQMTKGSFSQHTHGWVGPDEINNRVAPEQGTNDPLSATDRGYLYMLQHDVAEVVGLATMHGPLYIFIDDLDRCRPANVADTIEAINLFLNKAFGPCIFVMALDPATVAAHLETAFQDIDQRAVEDPATFGHLRHTGWRFMEKIIDLPIRLQRVPDTALSVYVDHLLNPEPIAAAPPPFTAPAPTTANRDRPQELPESGTQTTAVGLDAQPTTTVGLVITPDRPTTARSVAKVDEIESLPPVRDALRAALLSLPDRNPRRIKAFINLWRFCMVLDHRMGKLSPSLLAIERHSIEMARLVELMVSWPYLLDPLGQRPEHSHGAYNNLDSLLDCCAEDDETWVEAVRSMRLDPEDRTMHDLRNLLRRARPQREVFSAIAFRYL